MGSVSIRDLARNASGVINGVARSGRPALVTKHGKVLAAVVPVSETALEDFVLANAPEFVRALRQADEDERRGRTKDAFEVLDQIEESLSASRKTGSSGRKGSPKARASGSAPRSARSRSTRGTR